LFNIVDAAMILLLMKTLPHESIDKNHTDHIPVQTLRASFSGFGAGEELLLLADFGETELVPA
jgi:hypothetical protein